MAANLKILVLILTINAVSYTHLRAHETVLDLVCRLLLEKKKNKIAEKEKKRKKKKKQKNKKFRRCTPNKTINEKKVTQ